jgi:hypothetical protein
MLKMISGKRKKVNLENFAKPKKTTSMKIIKIKFNRKKNHGMKLKKIQF